MSYNETTYSVGVRGKFGGKRGGGAYLPAAFYDALLSGQRRHPGLELSEQAAADRGLARGDIVRFERIAREVEELRARAAGLGEQLPVAFADRKGRRLIALERRLRRLFRCALLAISPIEIGPLSERAAFDHRRQVDPVGAGGYSRTDDARERRQEVDALPHRLLVAITGLGVAAPIEDQRLADAAFVEAPFAAAQIFGAARRDLAILVIARRR